MKVAKFGGSSLATAEQVRRVCDIVVADPERLLIVVSAPGKRQPGDAKVTDLLIQCAEQRLADQDAGEALAAVVARYRDIQRKLGLPEALLEEIAADFQARLEGDRSHAGRFVDALKAGGEDNCAKLVAAALRTRDVEVRYIDPRDAGLVLSDEHGNAQVLPESFENLRALKEASGIGVFPGFFGYTPQGAVATFPRGGSDITGAVLAAAVGAEVYENFTDVDSVFAADPAIVPEAPPIRELTYREMRELAYAGFAIFHDEAIVPAVREGVPICIKSTNNPDAPGTTVAPEREHMPGEVVGVASSDGFCTVFLEKYLLNRQVGFGRRLLQIVEEDGLSYEHCPSGIDNICMILREDAFPEEVEQRVLGRIQGELAPDSISVERGLALVMVVGEGMRYSVGLAARATGALARAGVNIEMINQGSSEISMMFGIKADRRTDAVRALYDEFLQKK